MKPYSLDDHWDLLSAEYIERRMPWIDRTLYRLAIAWLVWRLKAARRG